MGTSGLTRYSSDGLDANSTYAGGPDGVARDRTSVASSNDDASGEGCPDFFVDESVLRRHQRRPVSGDDASVDVVDLRRRIDGEGARLVCPTTIPSIFPLLLDNDDDDDVRDISRVNGGSRRRGNVRLDDDPCSSVTTNPPRPPFVALSLVRADKSLQFCLIRVDVERQPRRSGRVVPIPPGASTALRRF